MPIVRPARPELRVPFPGPGPRRYLAAEGEEVQLDEYWRRALARGDVTLAEDPRPVAGSGSRPSSSRAQRERSSSPE